MKPVLMTIQLVSLLSPTFTKADTVCSCRLYSGRAPFGPIPWVNRGSARKEAKWAWEFGGRGHGSWRDGGKAIDRKEVYSRQANVFGGHHLSCEVVARVASQYPSVTTIGDH